MCLGEVRYAFRSLRLDLGTKNLNSGETVWMSNLSGRLDKDLVEGERQCMYARVSKVPAKCGDEQ